MPIYEYACSSCGFEKEFLQKMSDPLLTECPECHQSTLYKKVSASGFQLKGSGWYATDFKGGGNASSSGTAPSATAASSSDTASNASTHACGQGACGACA